MNGEGDTPDQAPQAAAGEFAVTGDADRVTEARPRRVTLRRDENGSYGIFMGRHMIQGFCSEFEDITSFHIEPDTQLQVRINIQQIGALHPATYPEREPLRDDRVPDAERGLMRIRTTDQGMEQEEVALFSQAHPHQPMSWQDQARRQVQEQMTRLQDMLNLLESM